MRDAVVHERFVVALQSGVVALLERLGQRLERAVAVTAFDLNPAPRRRQEDVAVVAHAAHRLFIDFGDLQRLFIVHVHAGDSDRRERRVDEHRLGHEFVDALEILDHPAELKLGGGDLPVHHRHPEPVPAQAFSLRERFAHENARIVGDLLLRGLDGTRRPQLPALHLFLQPALTGGENRLHAFHIALHPLLDEKAADALKNAERDQTGENAPAGAEPGAVLRRREGTESGANCQYQCNHALNYTISAAFYATGNCRRDF